MLGDSGMPGVTAVRLPFQAFAPEPAPLPARHDPVIGVLRDQTASRLGALADERHVPDSS